MFPAAILPIIIAIIPTDPPSLCSVGGDAADARLQPPPAVDGGAGPTPRGHALVVQSVVWSVGSILDAEGARSFN